MAVTDYTGLTIDTPTVGVKVTKVTDTSADFSSVASDTYFYNKFDGLPYYKNPSASVLSLFSVSASGYIVVVANYSALPSASMFSGMFYWCEASQGTKWLPGSLGGTYYPSGMYYSNGTAWEYMETPFQATQLEVDTGTDTDRFVSPATFANAAKWNTKQDVLGYLTGTETIDFGSENDQAKVTVLSVLIQSNIKAFAWQPIETTETSLDDFVLNGVSFNIENIINVTSFDIKGSAVNNASGVYTIKYFITI